MLQEFYVNATRKIRTPLAKPVARTVVRAYAAWCVDGLTPADIAAAFQIEDDARIGFWDALIITVAIRSGARLLLSEDLNAGQAIAGLAIFTIRLRLDTSSQIHRTKPENRLARSVLFGPSPSVCRRSRGTSAFERSLPVQVDRDWHLGVLMRRHRDEEALAVSGHAPLGQVASRKSCFGMPASNVVAVNVMSTAIGAPDTDRKINSRPSWRQTGRVSALSGDWPFAFDSPTPRARRGERTDIDFVASRLVRRIRHPVAVGRKPALRLVVLRLQKGADVTVAVQRAAPRCPRTDCWFQSA